MLQLPKNESQYHYRKKKLIIIDEKLDSQVQQKEEKLGYVQNILRLANDKMEADEL